MQLLWIKLLAGSLRSIDAQRHRHPERRSEDANDGLNMVFPIQVSRIVRLEVGDCGLEPKCKLVHAVPPFLRAISPRPHCWEVRFSNPQTWAIFEEQPIIGKPCRIFRYYIDNDKCCFNYHSCWFLVSISFLDSEFLFLLHTNLQ